MQKKEDAAKNRKKVEAYIPIVKYIAAICGPRCEVALHYLDDINHSIIAIENGYITGRKVGDGLVDLALGSVLDKSNKDKAFKAPNPYMTTQVVKTDANGVFTYVAPFAGWWGFAALNTSPDKMVHQGSHKNVELGAVLWTRFVDPVKAQ